MWQGPKNTGGGKRQRRAPGGGREKVGQPQQAILKSEISRFAFLGKKDDISPCRALRPRLNLTREQREGGGKRNRWTFLSFFSLFSFPSSLPLCVGAFCFFGSAGAVPSQSPLLSKRPARAAFSFFKWGLLAPRPRKWGEVCGQGGAKAGEQLEVELLHSGGERGGGGETAHRRVHTRSTVEEQGRAATLRAEEEGGGGGGVCVCSQGLFPRRQLLHHHLYSYALLS